MPHPTTAAVASHVLLDADALRANVRSFRDHLGTDVRIGLVIKGNAYGHGLEEMLPLLHAEADVLYAVTAGEALAVRALEARSGRPRRRVMVIGPLARDELHALAAADVEVVVGDADVPEALGEAAPGRPPLRVHVHVDSGLSREGFLPDALPQALAPLLARGPAIEVVGVMTHFADVEDVTEQHQALRQLARFREGERVLRAVLAEHGRPVALERHTAASAAAMLLPDSRMDLVRVGIAAYGLWPSRETRIGVATTGSAPWNLRPVLTWRCPTMLVKRVPAGSHVGYGCTHRCADDTTVAVLPVGYHDGYPRRVSHRAHVLIRGRRCPVLGRVMMNHVVVDVGAAVAPGGRAVATLLGEDGDDAVRAEDLAGWAETINYEITTRIGAHVARRVVDG